MDNFDLRKYLAENRLLKEEIDSQEAKKYESFKIAMGNEFDGAMRAMDQSPEEYLQDIIDYTEEFLDTKDTPLDEFDLSGFFEVENGVGRGDYTKEEAINFMKQWAEDKKSDLAKNKLIKEEVDISKISKLGDYNETEDSYKYKDHFVQKYIDGGKTIYAVFKDRGEKTDSYGSPDFESSDLKKVEDFLTGKKEPTGFLLRFSKEKAMEDAKEVLDQNKIAYNELGVHLVFHKDFEKDKKDKKFKKYENPVERIEDVKKILGGKNIRNWIEGEWKGNIYLKSEEEIKNM